jgi:hypothetical protein
MKNPCFAKKFDILEYEITKKMNACVRMAIKKNKKNVKCTTIEKECNVINKSND